MDPEPGATPFHRCPHHHLRVLPERPELRYIDYDAASANVDKVTLADTKKVLLVTDPGAMDAANERSRTGRISHSQRVEDEDAWENVPVGRLFLVSVWPM